MSIDNCQVVDGMGVDSARGVAVMLISDHLPWTAAKARILEDKLNAYVSFIQGGQLHDAIRAAHGLPVEVRLVHEHDPRAEDSKALDTARLALAEIGISFVHSGLPKGL